MLCAYDVSPADDDATCSLHLIDNGVPPVKAVVNIGGADFCAAHATEAMPQWRQYLQTVSTRSGFDIHKAPPHLISDLDNPLRGGR